MSADTSNETSWPSFTAACDHTCVSVQACKRAHPMYVGSCDTRLKHVVSSANTSRDTAVVFDLVPSLTLGKGAVEVEHHCLRHSQMQTQHFCPVYEDRRWDGGWNSQCPSAQHATRLCHFNISSMLPFFFPPSFFCPRSFSLVPQRMESDFLQRFTLLMVKVSGNLSLCCPPNTDIKYDKMLVG